MVLFVELLSGELLSIVDPLPGIGASFAKSALRTDAPALETVVLSGEEAVDEAAPAWREIERHGGATTPFQSLDMARACAKAHLKRGETPRLVLVLENGRPVLILPGVVGWTMGLRMLRFLGDPMIQYGDAICVQAEPDHFRAAWRALAQPGVADIAVLRKVRADARIAPFLSDISTVVMEDEAPFIDLARGHHPLQRHWRKLRRRRRKLAEHGEIDVAIERGEAARKLATQALEMKRSWLRARGLTSAVIGERAWEEAILSLAESDGEAVNLAAISLRTGGCLAAVELGFESGGRWHSYLGAMSPRFAKHAPGRLQMAEAFERLRREGVTVYDLLAPADDYKLDLATGKMKVRDHLAPIGWRGWLASYAAGLVPHMRAWLGWLPSACASG